MSGTKLFGCCSLTPGQLQRELRLGEVEVLTSPELLLRRIRVLPQPTFKGHKLVCHFLLLPSWHCPAKVSSPQLGCSDLPPTAQPWRRAGGHGTQFLLTRPVHGKASPAQARSGCSFACLDALGCIGMVLVEDGSHWKHASL